MDQQRLLTRLRDHFGSEFHATEKGGREEMAEWLAATQALTHEAALELLHALEATGVLHYVGPGTLRPDNDTMLEAARYGSEIPAPGTDPGLWRIGHQG